MNIYGNQEYWNRLLLTELPLPKKQIKEWIKSYAAPYKELMAYYKCAMMEVETKFRVLSEELSLEYDRNPIETIKTRLKSAESIGDKLTALNVPITVNSIEENLHDVAGVRIICGFPSDIYTLADAFLKQDDITLIEKKDYIANPKPNGYRSLHLIVEIPIFLHDEKRPMKVEVQFRTISMDWWASLEHKIRYKKDVEITPEIAQELYDCAEMSAELDKRMETIQSTVSDDKDTLKNPT
ncbi:MAG: GTP pyrophosphokinase family protein [Clostridia bacterium]|nr:GTP pyrophosphokinase family protein [Clostridia bacterium]